MKEVLALLGLIVVVAAVGFYAAGWMHVNRNDDTTTIQLESRKIKEATSETVQRGIDATRDVVNELERATEPLVEPTDTTVRPQVATQEEEQEYPVTVEEPATTAP